MGEKQDNGLDPCQIKQLHTHISHLGKEVPEEADNLTIKPVHKVIHDSGSYKIPNKQLLVSPHSLMGRTIHTTQGPQDRVAP